MEQPEEKPRLPKPEDPAPRDDVVVTQNRCPFCRDDVRASGPEAWVACAACLARHHEPCWGEGGAKCAACGHGERLRADSAPRRGRRGLAILVSVGLVLGAMVVVFVGTTSAERARADTLARRQVEAERVRARAEAAEADAAAAKRKVAERPVVEDERFAIARRVDELRKLNRSGSRADARRGRREAAWKQARVDLALAEYESVPEEVARFKAARKEIDRVDPPRTPGPDMPVESILEEQDDYLMPPRQDHAEFAAFTEKLRGRAQRPGYAAHLLVVTGDAKTALTEANRALDQDACDWLNWLARGEALLALGDQRGAAMALTVSEGFSWMDPTWALLARVELARARGDQRAELAAAYDALEVGQVPEWGGHLQALFERIATLEHQLGEGK